MRFTTTWFLVIGFILGTATLASSQTRELEVVVADTANKPIANVDVDVREWTVDVLPKPTDYDSETSERSLKLEISAFDLKTNQCCIQEINVGDESAISDCKLTLKPQPDTWLMDEIKRRQKDRRDRILANSNYMAEEIEKREKKGNQNLNRFLRHQILSRDNGSIPRCVR